MNARRRDSSRKGFPDNLYSKPDGYFWYRNPENGKTKGLGRDRAEAFREARLANAALAAKEGTKLADWVLGKAGKTLAVWALEYQQIYIDTRNAAPNTIKTLRSCIKAIIGAKFSGKFLPDVTTKDCAEFIDDAAISRGPRMAGAIRSALLDMYREAGVKGEVDNEFNPVTITRKPVVDVQRDRLSLEQFLAVREHTTGWMRNAINLALVTGQRRDDISSAQFLDIKDGFWYCEQQKTGMKIRIPLTLRLGAIGLSVADVVKQCRNNVVSKYLIHHENKTTLSKPGDQVWIDTISRGFAKARAKSGIKWREGWEPPTFHEIRSLAERLYEKERDGAFTQKLLGHKSEKMTAVYHDSRGSEWLDVGTG
jgi:integrase